MKKPSSFEIVKEALEVGGIRHQALEDETTKLIRDKVLEDTGLFIDIETSW